MGFWPPGQIRTQVKNTWTFYMSNSTQYSNEHTCKKSSFTVNRSESHLTHMLDYDNGTIYSWWHTHNKPTQIYTNVMTAKKWLNTSSKNNWTFEQLESLSWNNIENTLRSYKPYYQTKIEQLMHGWQYVGTKQKI